jgi:hypothetical protein
MRISIGNAVGHLSAEHGEGPNHPSSRDHLKPRKAAHSAALVSNASDQKSVALGAAVKLVNLLRLRGRRDIFTFFPSHHTVQFYREKRLEYNYKGYEISYVAMNEKDIRIDQLRVNTASPPSGSLKRKMWRRRSSVRQTQTLRKNGSSMNIAQPMIRQYVWAQYC